MTPIQYAIFWLGMGLEFLILWRGVRLGLVRHYPYLYIYLASAFVRVVCLIPLREISSPFYPLAYWWSHALMSIFRFLILWEIFRQCFFLRKSIRAVASAIILLVLTGLFAAFLFDFGVATGLFSPRSFFPDFERRINLSQVAVLVAIMSMVQYYGIRLGRNMWGVSIGLGSYLALSIVNHALLEQISSYFPLWQWTSSLSFVGLLGIWTWALWRYEPNPAAGAMDRSGLDSQQAGWERAWMQTRKSLTRVLKP